MRHPQLIVMLTHHDRTVTNAHAIFEACTASPAQFWGIKEEGLPQQEMAALVAAMKNHNKTTVLEVVAYTEEECLRGARLAVECGFDILMGTIFYDSVNDYCKQHNLKYMPFVGHISGRPSVLEGSLEEMLAEAKAYLLKGVYGLDLLGYRYTGNAEMLIRKFVEQVDAPVCIAGSINTPQRVALVTQAGAWAFTIGGAFFEGRFGADFPHQIQQVSNLLDAAESICVG